MGTSQLSKKRPAKEQGGREPKKRQQEVSKRSVPVTKGIVQEAVASSDEELQVAEEQENDGENAMEIDTPAPVKPGTSSAFESHKVQKELQSQRKAAKPNAVVMDQAKRIWATARQKDTPRAEREKLCKDLAGTVKGKVTEVVFKHDASRMIQTLVKYGKQEERNMVASELKGRFKELAQSKYSKFLVLKLMRYCPKRRSSILSEFHGHVLRLLLHREAGQVISDSFELYTNAAEKALLLREFYGKEVILFVPQQEGTKTGLRAILESLDTDRQKRILAATKENIQLIFENPEKGAVSNAIVHCALWEYVSELELLSDQTEADRLRREIIDLCLDTIAEMVHTRHGSLVSRYLLAYGTAKDRKAIIKLLKPHIERIALDAEAQLVLFTVLDVTDDTKMLTKSFLSDLTSQTMVKKLYADANGRRALLYPLVGRSTRHFTPAAIASIKSTDEIRKKAGTSKKDEALRREEIKKAVSEDMLKAVRDNAKEIMIDPAGSLLVTEVLLYADGDVPATIEAILKPLQAPYPGTANFKHPVELAHTARMIKTFLQGGHWSHTAKQIERSELFDASAFASAFVRIVGCENTDYEGSRITAMAQGDGSFVIAELCTRIAAEGNEADKGKLRGWFGKEVVDVLQAGEGRGVKTLIQNIEFLKS